MMKKFLSFVLIFSFLFLVVNSYSLASNSKTIKKSKLVNINSAGINELTILPGIGVKTAERIIKFRKTNGKFKKKSDLLKVKGIGEKKLKKIEKLIAL